MVVRPRAASARYFDNLVSDLLYRLRSVWKCDTFGRLAVEVPLVLEPLADLIDLGGVCRELATLAGSETFVSRRTTQLVGSFSEFVQKSLVGLLLRVELPNDVGPNGVLSSGLMVCCMRESDFLPQGVVFLGERQQSERLSHQTVAECGSTRYTASHQKPRVDTVELLQDVGTKCFDVAGDLWPQRCSR